MTLREIYQSRIAEPTHKRLTPAQAFIRELAELTHRSEISVKRWISDSKTSTIPDALAQEVLAKHFDTTPEELFPNKQ